MGRTGHEDSREYRTLLKNQLLLSLLSLLLSRAPVPRPLALAFNLGWVCEGSATHFLPNARDWRFDHPFFSNVAGVLLFDLRCKATF
jgi:hypothetical protein